VRYSNRQRRTSLRLYSFGVHRPRLEREIRDRRLPIRMVASPRQADAVVALRTYYRRNPGPLRDAEELGVPVHVLRSGGPAEIAHVLRQIVEHVQADPHDQGLARPGLPDRATTAADESDRPEPLGFIRQVQQRIASAR
jgi:hypothetical protein